MRQRYSRKVDGQLTAQSFLILYRLLQDNQVQFTNQARLFSQGYKIGWAQQPTGRVLPAHQGFPFVYVALGNVQDGLVLDQEAPLLDGLAQMLDGLEPLDRVDVLGGVVDGNMGLGLFGLVHGHIGGPGQRIEGLAVLGE